jgi:uncharacterized membrane protein
LVFDIKENIDSNIILLSINLNSMNHLSLRVLLSVLSFCLLALGNQALAQTTPAATSSLREVDGLKLNCPVPFEKGQAPAIKGYEELFVSRERWGAKTDGVEITVESMVFKDISIFNIQGAAKGSVDGISKMEGVTDPTYKIQDITIAGADVALRLSYKAKRFGKELRVESAYVIKGAHVWTVTCTFENSGPRPIFIGETVAKSVRLE